MSARSHGKTRGEVRGVVRRFQAPDAEAIQQIVAQSPEAATWPLAAYQQLDRSTEHPAWVVESNGSILGFLVARTLASDEGEILNLAIAPAHRRAGRATALLQACFAEFTRLHIQRVFLEVRESNLAATAFYEKQGFVRTGRRPAYYQNPPEAAVLLVRELTA
jgi:ribosomal-protein-alanine acetyltransferase